MKGYLKLALLAPLPFVLSVGPVEADEEPGVNWTYEYDCDQNWFGTKHEVEEGGEDWAGGAHVEWPGDCDVHWGAAT
jgi:hypothetical protein